MRPAAPHIAIREFRAVAQHLYDLGYRKWSRYERYVTGNTEWFLPDFRVDDFGGAREKETG